MYCVEYFHKFNTGPGTTEHIIFFEDPKNFNKEYLNELVAEPICDVESYRGYSYKILDKIPKELLLSRIDAAENSIRNQLAEIQKYKNYLSNMYNESI